MVHVHRVELGTTCQRRDCFTRIQQFEWIETLANRVELVALGFAELDTHLAELFDADSMLAGDSAAALDTELQNLAAQFLGSLEFTFIVGVVQDYWMQVTVAGMKDIGDRQFIFR